MQLAVFMGISLDGCIARPDGGIDWLVRAHTIEGEDFGFATFYASVDALLMGRGTYDKALEFPEWPYAGKRVIVLTNRPAEPKDGVEFVSGDIRTVVEGLSGLNRIYVDGGIVIRSALQAGLVTEITLTFLPIILGSGIRLWADGLPETDLQLVETKSWPNGLVQLAYKAGR